MSEAIMAQFAEAERYVEQAKLEVRLGKNRKLARYNVRRAMEELMKVLEDYQP